MSLTTAKWYLACSKRKFLHFYWFSYQYFSQIIACSSIFDLKSIKLKHISINYTNFFHSQNINLTKLDFSDLLFNLHRESRRHKFWKIYFLLISWHSQICAGTATRDATFHAECSENLEKCGRKIWAIRWTVREESTNT